MIDRVVKAVDTNEVFSPCIDAKVQRHDGFTFGLAFSSKEAFFLDNVQLSPCDSRLALPAKLSQLALFRPKVDEISLLTVNSTVAKGPYMVAFAGRKYAARSQPIMVVDTNNMLITSFTLVLEFQKGILNNLYWKNFGCDSCPQDFICLDGKECAVPSSKCRSVGGTADCDIGIQIAFSGTDKNFEALNTWYEVSNLRRYSLYGLYSNVRDTINQFTQPFSQT
ncbi:CSL zinc finger domain-containing protein [Euphorbia peplus]|nr:CSL zinc finger domain-containing protein [Euphorbia peplus]